MRIPQNSQIRRICISDALFYAPLIFKCEIIVLNCFEFYGFIGKNPAPKRGIFACIFSMQVGAGGRTRTGTPSLAVDFESTTSTNSITPAVQILP